MTKGGRIAAGVALGVLTLACLGGVTCVASGMGLAALGFRPHTPDARTGSAAAPDTHVDDAPADDAGLAGEPDEVAAPPEPDELVPSDPSAESLRLDRAFWTEAERHPDGDAHAVVARREHIEVQALMAAISEVSAYRVRIEAEAREALAGRRTIEVLPEGVHGSAAGNTTLDVRMFVPGCPRPRGADPDQLALAQDMVLRLHSIIPDGVDSFDADLWSDGEPCGRRQLSFHGTWSREDNRVSLRDR